MIVSPLSIIGAFLVTPDKHQDWRGHFTETYRREWFADAPEMVQMNHTERRARTVVGFHYHIKQTDYWHIARGKARVILHDLREGSASYRQTVTMDLFGQDSMGLLIPPGVAHGFAAHSDVELVYLIDRYHDPDDEHGVAWDDPEIGAVWGVGLPPLLSERDSKNPGLRELTVRP